MNCQDIKYSDILEGKYDIEELEQITRLQNVDKTRSKSNVQQSNHYKDLIHELIDAQSKCADNINQLGSLLNQRTEYMSSKKYSQQNSLIELSSPKLQQSQISQLSPQMYTPSKMSQSSMGSYSPSQSFLNQLHNEYSVPQNSNILDQIDKLIKIRKLDSQILLRIIRKHMNDCPHFVQVVKQEFRNSINSM